MTPNAFRRIALALDGAIESAHHGHPDFRVGGRVFATLGYPDRTCGMVSLTPDQQRSRTREHPAAFVPVNGKWGEQGATTVSTNATTSADTHTRPRLENRESVASSTNRRLTALTKSRRSRRSL